VGALLTGVFADRAINGVFDGALYGNPAQLGIQAMAVGTAILYSGVASFALLKLIGLFMPLRATIADEASGLDLTMHGEEAYLHDGGMEAITPETASGPAGSPAPVPVR
jgi:Amt family ammonium transporter